MSWEAQREDNRSWWDGLAERHEASDFYDLPAQRAGREVMRSFELAELQPVEGRSLCHLQCHIGTDTLAWARHGARVVGVDFSEPALAAARRLAAALGVDAEFVHSDVYAAPEALGGRTFDIVYTGYGALVWLPDLVRWAEVAATLLAPGGRLYLSEFHPFHEMLSWETFDIEYSYFQHGPQTQDEEGEDYAGTGSIAGTTHEWLHPLGEVVSAVAGAGLKIEFLHEREGIAWRRWPFLVGGPEGQWTLPPDRPRIPLQYTLLARKG